MAKYQLRLQCPKCGSFNWQYTLEKIFDYNTKTKKDGWLREKDSLDEKSCTDAGTEMYNCLDCDHTKYPKFEDNCFIIEQREIEV